MNRTFQIAIITLCILGCVPSRNILTPIEESKVKAISNHLIYSELSESFQENVKFNGSYLGYQCSPEIESFEAFSEQKSFENYESYECTCYNYKVVTDLGNDLYIGISKGFYLNTRICYDSDGKIVEEPKISNLQITSQQGKTKHIELDKVKIISEDHIDRKSKFGKFPVLVYQINSNKILWKVKRHYGKLNVSVYQIDIDAETGEIIKSEKLPYRRSFWQWVSGTGI